MLDTCDALLVLQYFWFRHLFTLSSEQAARCQQIVVQLMRDKKLEVQEMAAGTLAGLLKGLSQPAFNELRSDLLHQAQQLFPRRQKNRSGSHWQSRLSLRFAESARRKSQIMQDTKRAQVHTAFMFHIQNGSEGSALHTKPCSNKECRAYALRWPFVIGSPVCMRGEQPQIRV